jgi:hypothetical protein
MVGDAVAQLASRPLKNPGLIGNGKWEMANCQAFSIFHLRFAMQDAFSIGSYELFPEDQPRRAV